MLDQLVLVVGLAFLILSWLFDDCGVLVTELGRGLVVQEIVSDDCKSLEFAVFFLDVEESYALERLEPAIEVLARSPDRLPPRFQCVSRTVCA